jgi:predicted RNase H-like HicB family nuclease
MKYVAIIEPTSTGFSAYLPDLPGCVSTGRTLDDIRRNIRDAAEFHIESLAEHHEPIPQPHVLAYTVDTDTPTTA